MTDFNNQIDNDIKQLITKSGDCRYILKSVRPIEIKGKTYLLETFTDINKQVRIEEELKKLNIELETKVKDRTKELQKNETKYKSLIENLRHEYFFYRHNTEGVFEYVSPSIEYILGYQPEDFLMHYAKYLTDNPINQEAIERAELSMQGIQQLPYELEIYDIQKNIHTLEVSETPIVDSEGNVISVEGIVRDITSQKKAEELINKQLKEIQLNNEEIKSVNEEIHSVNDDLQNRLDDIRELNEYLKISEDKFRTLVRNIPGVVYRCLNDEHWTMQFISAEIETFSGYPASAFINNKVRSFASIIHHDDQRKVAESGYNLNKKNKSFVLEYRIIHANGSIMWVYDRGHYIFKDNSDEIQYLDGVIIDITEKKRAEEKLKESESQLQITNAQKDKFFSLLAHDLRSPIGNFLQISELLKTSYESLTPDQITDFFDNLYSLSDVTFKLLENLLMWSRSQLGRLETHPEDINLFEIVVNVGELYEENLKRKDIKLRNEIPLDLIVQTDLNFIQTIFRNLISNAIKFSYTGGSITIQTNIKEETNNDGESILISVKDKGIGIPKDVIDIIFDIDTDYSTMGTASEKGTGLGLILCKELVEKNGGKIWVESDEDNGSAFYFTLKR